MFRARYATVVVIVLGLMGLGASCNRTNGNTTTAAQATQDVRSDTQTAAGPPAITEVPGLAVDNLSVAERERFWAVANDELSPCGDPHSLAACGRDANRSCAACMPALRFLARRVSDGFPREALGDLVRARYARTAVQQLRIEGAPVRGAAAAPVTLVEFSDYTCPHCGRAAPVMRELEREFDARLRVIHMHFPLSGPGHQNAMPASRAAVAAQRQDHFWEFHDVLFAHQDALDTADLERYARDLHLDLTRWRADIASPGTEALISANRREGDRVGVDATPTIFINGRRYPHTMPIERAPLRDWIQEEVDGAAHP